MQLKIIYSKREDNIMSSDKIFNPTLTKKERENLFEENKKKFLIKNNLKEAKIIIPVQKTIYEKQDETFNYKDGSYEILTKENIKEYFKGEKLFHTDFLIMDENIKNVFVCDKVADCPMLILVAIKKESQTLAIAHCGGEYINRFSPKQMMKTLIKESNVSPSKIKAYITPCISKKSYKYDKYPPFVTNKSAWKNSITKEKDNYYIDLREAIKNQLIEEGIKKENINISPLDTKENQDFYSHCAYKNGDITKKGRFLAGAIFID